MSNGQARNIPFLKSDIKDIDIDNVAGAMKAAAVTHENPLDAYEKLFSELTGIPHITAVNSLFSALLLSLKSLEIKQGDEVIAPSFTEPEIGGAVEHSGASIVFADIEPDTLTLSPASIKEKISGKTKVILIGDTAGMQADLGTVEKLAASNGIYVVYYTYYNPFTHYCKAGTGPCPHITVFTHNEVFVKGAVIATGMERTGKLISRLAGHGNESLKHAGTKGDGDAGDGKDDWYYEIVNPGLDCRMTHIQSAFHASAIKASGAGIERRGSIAGMYTGLLKPINNRLLSPTADCSTASHTWQMYIVRLIRDALSITRDEFIKELLNKGIEVSVHYVPLHIQPYYSKKYKYRYNDLIRTYEAYIAAVSLPLYASLSDDDVHYVAQTVTNIVKKFAQ
jgi:dTDP-4-amino-4,6-dideoxygalactose transaminase